jgi:hypothetical protein
MIAGLDQIDAILPPALSLIAASGHDRELAQFIVKSAEKYGGYGFYFAWQPDLKGARAQPEFIELTRRYNIPGFWRLPNHRPDVCKGSSPEPVCKLI